MILSYDRRMDAASALRAIPKVELHIHLESAITPQRTFELARANGVPMRFESAEALRAAYDFASLDAFLELLWLGNEALRTEGDFAQLGTAYLASAARDGVVHAEAFISPQAHTSRGVRLDTVLAGVLGGLELGSRDAGISAGLICNFQRHRSEDECFETLCALKRWREEILGVGLGASEAGNPPRKFERLFKECRALGWRLVAHAGEEGPAAYVEEALDVLGVERIDHGVRCEEDPALVARLARTGIGLTVCPVSNVRLKVVPDLQSHNLARLLTKGVRVTINSDNPREFGATIGENFEQCREALGLGAAQIFQLAENSIAASFLPDAGKASALERLARVRADPGVSRALS
jgi:adenosine deaminase